jgi:hypothetical protein
LFILRCPIKVFTFFCKSKGLQAQIWHLHHKI